MSSGLRADTPNVRRRSPPHHGAFRTPCVRQFIQARRALNQQLRDYVHSYGSLKGVRPVEPNPFAEAPFVELQHVCSEAIRAREQPAFKTAAEKRVFARRLRFLLIALSMRLRCGPTIPGMPEVALEASPHATIVGEFMPLYERTVREEIEASRNFILQRAADFVLGKRGQVWLLSEHRANRAA